MQFRSSAGAPFSAKTDGIVVPLSEAAASKLPPELKPLDEQLDGLLTAALALKDFKGEEHTTFSLLTNGKIPAARVLLVGTGKPKDRTLLEWQHVVGIAARVLQAAKCTRWALVLPSEVRRAFRPEDLGRMTAKGVLVSTYHFSQYKSDPAAKLPMPEEIIVGPLSTQARRRFDAGAREGAVIGEAMNWMRDFGNMPSSDATPTFLAEKAKELASAKGAAPVLWRGSASGGKTDKRFHLKVIDRPEMEKLGMGALLGVSRGAATPPKCIVLEWRGDPSGIRPERSRRANGRRSYPSGWYALVGKAITFDSGGISIKPSAKLDEMKFDMSGGAAVLGALKAIAALGLRCNVVGIIPACDNMPSGSAYKPGDILRTCRGKTLEIMDTDAEGRVVLADGIGYALRYEPTAIVDLATLTGAIGIALGSHYTGLFANNPKLFAAVRDAADASGDRCWHMPLGDAYTREVQSDIADLNNIGKAGRLGGASTAAAFLEACVEGKPWAHLDIAYTAWTTELKPWLAKGATGVGVHLLVELAKKWVT